MTSKDTVKTISEWEAYFMWAYLNKPTKGEGNEK